MSHVVIDEDRCKGCALCTLVCPHDLVHIADRFNAKGYRPSEFTDPQGRCTGCTNCAIMCPDVAIVVYRTSRQGVIQSEATGMGQRLTPRRQEPGR
jgi:2-oxoglutarate ferredoxin oxidoreductase subunit delta